MAILERIRSSSPGTKKLVLVISVTVTMIVIVAAWRIITPIMSPQTESVPAPGASTTDTFAEMKRSMEELKDAAGDIRDAVNDLTDTIRAVASTTISTSSENIASGTAPTVEQ
jgi:hypothetical protein